MDFIASHSVLFWFLLGILLLVLEELSLSFFLVFFGGGALAAAATAFIIPDNWTAQWIVFMGASVLGLVFLRRKLRSFFQGYLAASDNMEDPVVKERYLGREVVVKREISPGQNGLVELDGTDWQAGCETDAIPIGEKVRVDGINGLVLTVARRDRKSTPNAEA